MLNNILNKNEIKLKKITPIDLLESDYIIPFQIFQCVQKDDGIWGKINQANNINKTIDKEAIKPAIYSLLKISVVGFNEFIFEQQYTIDEMINIADKIINISLKLFKKFFQIKKDTALYIDQLAKRYGVTPIQFICSDVFLYNDLDAFLFNTFIQNIAVMEENLSFERQKQKAKSKRRF